MRNLVKSKKEPEIEKLIFADKQLNKKAAKLAKLLRKNTAKNSL